MKSIIVLIALLTCIAMANATTPWVPIVKDNHENQVTTSQFGHPEATNLVGASPVAFRFVRGQVPASSDPAKVEKRKLYGAYGTREELKAFPDDWLPISEDDYHWQERSPIYWNPHMDYYWGFQQYNIEDSGQFWYETIPMRYDEWPSMNGDSRLSWDKDQYALHQWATKADIPMVVEKGA